MAISPLIKTFHNQKGKTIRILKDEIIVPVVKKIDGKDVKENLSVSKKIRTVVYDKSFSPLNCREVVWSKGKIIKEDVYQPLGKGVVLRQGHGKNQRKTFLDNLNFSDIVERFFK